MSLEDYSFGTVLTMTSASLHACEKTGFYCNLSVAWQDVLACKMISAQTPREV